MTHSIKSQSFIKNRCNWYYFPPTVTVSCMKYRFGPIRFNVSKRSPLIIETAADDYSNSPAHTIEMNVCVTFVE